MRGPRRVVSGPATEPLTVTELKTWLRIDGTADDALLATLITAERRDAEDICWRTLITTTYDYVLDAWPDSVVIKLERPPIVSITSVSYTDIDGITAIMPATDYFVDTDNGQLVLADGANWPAVTLRRRAGLRIRYVAGYGATAADVPENYKLAIMLGVALAYERDAMLPLAAQRLHKAREALLIKDRP